MTAPPMKVPRSTPARHSPFPPHRERQLADLALLAPEEHLRLPRPRGGLPAAAARPAPRPGTADGRGLHARLPVAGPRGSGSRTRTSSTSTAPAASGCSPRCYKVFGTQLVVERLFALLQQIGIVAAVYGLARDWGRTIALCCGIISLIIIVPPDRAHRARVGRRRGARPARAARHAPGPQALPRGPDQGPPLGAPRRLPRRLRAALPARPRHRDRVGPAVPRGGHGATVQAPPRHRVRDRHRRLPRPHRHGRPEQRARGHGAATRLRSPGRAQAPRPAAVGPLRRVPAEVRGDHAAPLAPPRVAASRPS